MNADTFLKISPGAHVGIVRDLAVFLPRAFASYHIETKNQQACFLGQAAEETAGFRTLVEYASGEAYEGRRDLGNIEKGDGPRFKGRGIFQITGRFNYSHFSKILGIDLIANPELAASPNIACMTASVYWNLHGLSPLADRMNIAEITRRINGGFNGLLEREHFTERTLRLI